MSQPSLRSNGALGITFLSCRGLQAIFALCAMGISAKLVSVLVDTSQEPPTTLIGALSIACFTLFYAIISFVLYYDNQLPKPYCALTDGLFLTALVTTSVVVSKPLSHLSCDTVGIYANAAAASALAEKPSYINEGFHSVKRADYYIMPLTYEDWVGGAERTCDMMKAVWVLSILITILFAVSATCLAFMWKKEREPQGKHYAVNV